jgi:hypothetical protein
MEDIQGSVLVTAVFIDTAVHKIGDFIVENLREFEAILKKALTCVSGALRDLFCEQNQRLDVSCQGPSSIYISGDSISSLLLFYHEDNILLPNPAWW